MIVCENERSRANRIAECQSSHVEWLWTSPPRLSKSFIRYKIITIIYYLSFVNLAQIKEIERHSVDLYRIQHGHRGVAHVITIHNKMKYAAAILQRTRYNMTLLRQRGAGLVTMFTSRMTRHHIDERQSNRVTWVTETQISRNKGFST